MHMHDRSAATFDGTDYAPGRKFRVARDGLTLTGYTPVRGGAQEWRQALQVGDILTCTGYGPGFGGDPGYGVEFTSEQSEAARAFHCDISPMNGGPFGCRPPVGSLEPADAGGEAESDG
jgi:hypothetical protein